MPTIPTPAVPKPVPGFFPLTGSEITLPMRDLVKRLVAVLREENALLKIPQKKSLEPIIQKKSQLLLEIMRLEKNKSLAEAELGFKNDVLFLKEEIMENQRLLSVNLVAAKEITDAILGALRETESDGTYGRPL